MTIWECFRMEHRVTWSKIHMTCDVRKTGLDG